MRIALILFLLIEFIFCHAQRSELILNLKKGVEYTQSTNSEATIIQEINGEELNIIMTVKGSMTYLVEAVNDEGFEMGVTYKSLSMSMQSPQGLMEFSSEKNDENDIFSLLLTEMKNKEFQVKMTRYGKIVEVRNIDYLFQSAFNKFPEITEAQREQIKTQLSKAYGEEAFKGSIEMVTAIYPSKKVSEGDEWTVNTKLESGMSANVTTTYKFTDRTKEHYFIEGNSKIETEDKDAYIETNGMPMKFDLKGTMISDIKIDKKSGWIVEAKINQEIQGDTFVKANPQMPNGLKIPMIMRNKMIFTDN